MGLRQFAEDEISTCESISLGCVIIKDDFMSHSNFKSKLLQKGPVNYISYLKTKERDGFLWFGEQTAEHFGR